MITHGLMPLKQMGSESCGIRWHGSCPPTAPTRRVPKQAVPALNLNCFQSKQLFYKQHVIPYLKK